MFTKVCDVRGHTLFAPSMLMPTRVKSNLNFCRIASHGHRFLTLTPHGCRAKFRNIEIMQGIRTSGRIFVKMRLRRAAPVSPVARPRSTLAWVSTAHGAKKRSEKKGEEKSEGAARAEDQRRQAAPTSAAQPGKWGARVSPIRHTRRPWTDPRLAISCALRCTLA